MATLNGVKVVELTATPGKNLDTLCYRGTAPLAHLALISQPDVFDQVANPEGLQRDLSPKHASDAYEYVARDEDPEYPRAFPEVVLNVRRKEDVEIEELDGSREVALRFDRSAIKDERVHVSRVDGNHRLWNAAGDERRSPLMDNVPFQIHIGLTREQERSLFVDINSNQKGMNTSHLAVMQHRLTPEEQEIKDHLDRWIAHKLATEGDSPWHGLVHMGGAKQGSRAQGLNRALNFASIQNGVKKLLLKSQYITDLTDPHAQYALIRNYWTAVKKTFIDEWADPKSYLLLKNIGVWSLSYLGGSIIDRCIPQGKYAVSDFEFYLEQAHSRFDWLSNAAPGERTITGMSGNKAALIIAAEMAAELSDEQTLSTADMQAALLSD